ncbi:MAG: sulfatase family protein [Flavicella sp.]
MNYILRILVFILVTHSSVSSQQPNILFVIADDMSHTSAYGYDFVKTPHFDKLGEEGLRFTHMYTPSSKCSPSRAVILTGRNPWQLEAAANHRPKWPEKFKSVIETLVENGYTAGYTGKGWGPGISPKGRQLTGKEYNQILKKNRPTKKIALYDYAANFEQFLSEKPKEKPFIFWYGCREPHRDYVYKSGVRLGKSIDEIKYIPSFWENSESTKHDLLDYAIEVEYFDQQLGKILKHLKKSGELENTLIIATSDNAMPFPRYKGHPHEFATRIPFVVNWPNKIKNRGRICTEFASFIDIAPTLLEVTGIDNSQSGMHPIQGQSLVDFFDNKVEKRDFVLTGRERNAMVHMDGKGYPVRSIHKGKWVYMHNFDPERLASGDEATGYHDTKHSPTKDTILANKEGKAFQICFGKRPQEELYNIEIDSECMHNLAGEKKFQKLKKEMKKELFTRLKNQKDPRILGDPSVFDHVPKHLLKKYDIMVKRNNKYKKMKTKSQGTI